MTDDLQSLIQSHETHAKHVAGLAARIAEKQLEAKREVIADVKQLMDELGVTLADLGGVAAVKTQVKAGRAAVAPKYRDEVTGATWSGRGMRPRWLKAATDAGKDVEHFRIKPALPALLKAA